MALWRNATCEGLLRVRKHLVGRDASCEETLCVDFRVRETSMENRFVRGIVSYVFQFLKRCEPPLMLIYGEFGTVA